MLLLDSQNDLWIVLNDMDGRHQPKLIIVLHWFCCDKKWVVFWPFFDPNAFKGPKDPQKRVVVVHIPRLLQGVGRGGSFSRAPPTLADG